MHRDGTLIPLAPAASAPVAGRAVAKTLILGVLLQALAALPVYLLAVLQQGMLYPVSATLAGAATGFLFARAARERPVGRQLLLAGGLALLSGGLGALGMALLGSLAGELVPVAALTSAVAGAAGALLSWLWLHRRRPES